VTLIKPFVSLQWPRRVEQGVNTEERKNMESRYVILKKTLIEVRKIKAGVI
jgi:hypothetical protein